MGLLFGFVSRPQDGLARAGATATRAQAGWRWGAGCRGPRSRGVGGVAVPQQAPGRAIERVRAKGAWTRERGRGRGGAAAPALFHSFYWRACLCTRSHPSPHTFDQTPPPPHHAGPRRRRPAPGRGAGPPPGAGPVRGRRPRRVDVRPGRGGHRQRRAGGPAEAGGATERGWERERESVRGGGLLWAGARWAGAPDPPPSPTSRAPSPLPLARSPAP